MDSFEILAKISSSEAVESGELLQRCAEIIQSLDTLDSIIEGSPFYARARLRKNINEAVNDTLMLCRKPELIYRSCIGILWGDSAGYQLVRKTFGNDFIESLPCMIFNSDTIRYSISNKFGQEITLSQEEYKALIDLSKNGINVADVASSVSYFKPLKRKSSVYILMPDEKLSRLCDVVFVIGNSEIKWTKSSYQNIQVHTVNNAAELEKLLDQYDGHTNNITLTDRLKAEMFTYEAELKRIITNYQKTSAALKREAFMQNNDATKDLINSTIRELDNMIRNVESWKNWQVKFQARERKTLFEISNAIEDAMSKAVSASKNFSRIHTGTVSPKSLYLKIALKLIELGDVNAASAYQKKAEAIYNDTAFLIGLYCSEALGYSISYADVEKLRYMPDSDDVLKTKLHFRKKLNLSEDNCANIAGILNELETPEELYFYAIHLNNLYSRRVNGVSFSDVTNAFRRAVLAGSIEAADMFAQYCAGNDLFDGTKEIADMAFPTAAWACFLVCTKHGKTNLASRYLKFAAALGNVDATKFLADTCWNERRKSQTGIGFDPKSGKFTGIDTKANSCAISIYEHIYSNRVPVSNANEKLAHFYFCAGNFSKARGLLGDSPKTADGLFDLAVMLKYAHGGGRDNDRATKLIIQSHELGHPFAKALNEYWFMEEAQKLKNRYGM